MPIYTEISPEDACPRLPAYHVVDVRAQHEFDGPLGHIGGAQLIPLPELAERAKELPGDHTLLLVCRSGKRSGTACETLTGLGIGPVVNLRGGMIAWNQAHLPVEEAVPRSRADLLGAVAAWHAQVAAIPREEALDLLREWCRRHGDAVEQPSRATVAKVLDFIEKLHAETDAPPDLALSITSFRRALAAL